MGNKWLKSLVATTALSVLVAGAAVADGDGQKVLNGTVVCLGEALIDFVPTEGGLGLANKPMFVKAAGGAPATPVHGGIPAMPSRAQVDRFLAATP